MLHTVFINGEDQNWSKEISNHLLSAGEFVISDDAEKAAIRIELEGSGLLKKQISIYAEGRSLALPPATAPGSLVALAQLLLAGVADTGFERTAAFPLMQKMVNVIGHDIRNPLNNILLATAQFRLETLPDAEETAMYIDIIERSCDRINNLMSEIAEPLSSQALITGPVLLKDLMEVVAGEYREYMELYNISWQLNIETDNMLLLDADKIKIAVNHIIENSIESMKGGGNLSATIGRNVGKGPYLLIRDSGSGISKENTKKVFYPFFTTKDRKKGLGLTLADRIITAHGGSIQVKSNEGLGTDVMICFPS